MGNRFCQNMSGVEPQEIEAPPIGEQNACKKLTFHLLSYREVLGLKDRKKLKWASSKLMLTDELLKAKKKHCPRPLQAQDNNTSWVSYESLLTDDENEEPDQLSQELSSLEKYRRELRGTILQIATTKKREKKTLKRLKRRTLISSKKPSNKLKYASCEMLIHQHSEQQQTEGDN